LIMLERGRVVTLDVGDDPEILFDPSAQGSVAAGRLQRRLKGGEGGFDLTLREVEGGEGVERPGREQTISRALGRYAESLAQLAGGGAVETPVVRDGEEPERLGERAQVARPLRCADARLVIGDGVGEPALAVVRRGLLQKRERPTGII